MIIVNRREGTLPRPGTAAQIRTLTKTYAWLNPNGSPGSSLLPLNAFAVLKQ